MGAYPVGYAPATVVSMEFVRSFFLFLSRQKHLRQWMETSPLAQRLATRFVAGETLDKALAVSRRLNGEGIAVTLDHLGESVTSLEEAAQARDVYRQALEAMRQAGIEPNVSLKLTQFGLDLSADACRANVEQLVRRAAEIGGLRARGHGIERVYGPHAGPGQRNSTRGIGPWERSSRLIFTGAGKTSKSLCQLGIRVRLCKGAYLEPHSAAFPAQAAGGRKLPGIDEAVAR